MKVADRLRLPVRRATRVHAMALLVGVCLMAGAPAAQAAIAAPSGATPRQAPPTEKTGGSLEAAAAKAGSTGRAVAMSLIGLAFAVAAIVLAFRRDFKEAASVFAVGIVCVLLATPTGVSVLRDTVNSLFGSR
jgi:lysylphosphatidylglycerol synthetase-like protein (DUF2156 family)